MTRLLPHLLPSNGNGDKTPSKNQKQRRAGQSTKPVRTDWATPIHVVRALEKRLGIQFDLDACAQEATSKAPRWYDGKRAATDGLIQSWAARHTWCNPPFGAAIPYWATKLGKELDKGFASGGTDVCAFCVPPRTDTRWWHSLRRSPYLVAQVDVDGRIAYEIDGQPQDQNNAPTVILILARPGALDVESLGTPIRVLTISADAQDGQPTLF